MAKTTSWVQISGYLFLLGIVIAIVSAFAPGVIPSTTTILVVLGAIIGLLAAVEMGSIGKDETELFLLAVIALGVAGTIGPGLSEIPTVGKYVSDIVNGIGALVAPAAVLIALRAIWKAGAVRVM
jgi:hypothetical protein